MMTVSSEGFRGRLLPRILSLLICMLTLAVAFLPAVTHAAASDAPEDGEASNVFDPLVFRDPGTVPSEVSSVYGDIAPALRLEAYPAYIGRIGKLEWWKFTLYGTENLLIEMKDQLSKKDEPFAFRYVLEFEGATDLSFQGNIAYGVQRGENSPSVTRFNMVLNVGEYRYLDNVHCKRSADNQLSWLVEMPQSAHFDIEKITGYRLSVYSAEDRRQKLVYDFPADGVQSVTALYTPLRRGGALKIDMPSKDRMTLTIIDPRIPDGYTNSPVEKGVIEPYWQIKIVLSALEWFEIKLDGTNGEPMEKMKFYCGHYLRKPDNSNQYSPRSKTIETAAECAYAIDGDQLSFTVQYPPDRPIDFTYIDYIAIDMNNGTVIRVNQYPLF